ncbi:MAG: PBS lyase [Planctomycetaceae bacterium]|nr:PBS lyase [Planctomycetaceae bacterium]MCP4463192.1 PBS lyase [Planctomycetaceae bacterium]
MNKYFPKPFAILFCGILFSSLTQGSGDAQEASKSAAIEQEKLNILSSDASAAEKAIACKHLAIHGSVKSLPELAKLLPDPQLSSWARIALEAIPGEQADQVLLEAIPNVDSPMLVGVINSIGVRQNASAVEALKSQLANENGEVAAAAAVALGRIGNPPALAALRPLLTDESKPLRSAAAEGCILIAEKMLAADESATAIEIFDNVRNSDVPMQRIVEATRGAILASPADGIPLLLEQLRSDDKKRFQLALGIIREFPGVEIDRALPGELAQADPARAALMLQAMSDRPDTVLVSAILDAAKDNRKPVQLSAIEALGRVGDRDCLDTLMEIATASDSELSAAAKEALAALPGVAIDQQILKLLSRAEGDNYRLLIELIGQRRLQATPMLLTASRDDSEAVRHAALVALGETVTPEDLSELIELVINSKQSGDTAVAQKALRAASVRMPDQDACATQLSRAMRRSQGETKGTMLEILADVGGPTALVTLGRAANSDDPQLQDVGSRLLGKWNSLDAAPVLLDLAKNGPARKYQIRALRGYTGIARKFNMPPKERARMCQLAFETATRPAEQKLVLSVLQIHPHPETLQLAVQALEVPEVKMEAMQAVLNIASKLPNNDLPLEKLIADVGMEPIKLEILKAEYGAGSTFVDVTEALKKHAGNLPLVKLPSEQYNSVFGGDPAPGDRKQLKVRFRIDGEEGEASFNENAPIILFVTKK